MDVVTRLASDNYYHIAFCRTSLLSAELPSSSHKYSAMKQISEVTYLVSWFLVSCRMTTTPFNCGILGKWPTWRTIFYVFIYIFNCLHVSSTTCSSSGETNCVITTSGSCRWLCRVQVGSETSDLHTKQPPTHSDSYQRLYWHNLSLLMMSTMCSKHAES